LESTDDAIVVRNASPAKMPPLDTRLIVGIRQGDHFHAIAFERGDEGKLRGILKHDLA
jgi:hypothetical protein